jgi:hypothetical protein
LAAPLKFEAFSREIFLFQRHLAGFWRTNVFKLKESECLDWQYSQFINIVGKDDVNPAAPNFKQGEVARNARVNLVRHS